MRNLVPTRRSALLLAAGTLFSGSAWNSAAQPAAAGAFALGSPRAPVTVTEYASVTCGRCAAWDAEVWPAFKARYVDTGKVRFELREMLTSPVELSAAGWLLARCAGPGKSLQVVKALYRSQAEMARSADVRRVLLRIGREAGLTERRSSQCMGDPNGLAALNNRVEAAVQRGVVSTPTFFINGERHFGDITLAGLDAALAPLLAPGR